MTTYFNLSINRSHTLKALAIIVNAGLTEALDRTKAVGSALIGDHLQRGLSTGMQETSTEAI